jgi:hypothetical protein
MYPVQETLKMDFLAPSVAVSELQDLCLRPVARLSSTACQVHDLSYSAAYKTRDVGDTKLLTQRNDEEQASKLCSLTRLGVSEATTFRSSSPRETTDREQNVS